MGLLNHQQLLIVKGVGKTPGDTLSSEKDPVVIDLLNSAAGYSLIEWKPNIPSLKQGGIWADSPISDGRQLVAGVNTNVIETMTLQLTGATCTAFAAQFAALNKLIQEARAFHDTAWQIEPIYLQWKAQGAPGAQYALIYSIDTNITFQDSPTIAQAELILTIEREPYWRGIAPGDNPKRWTYYKLEQPFVSGRTSLLTGTDHIATNALLENRAEQATDSNGYVTQNFIDIPAANIPGDAPALLCLSSIQSDTTLATTLVIGKSTKPNTGNIARFNGRNQYLVYSFNAADASVVTDTTLAADTGTPLGISGLRRRAETTFVTATMVRRLDWNNNSLTQNGLSLSVLRGRFAIFARARVSAAATVNIEFVARQSGTDKITNTPVVLTDLGAGGTGNTTDWALLYLGQITLPFDSRKTETSVDGQGVSVYPGGGPGNISLSIFASRTSGAGLLYFSDLILIPIDEGAVKITSAGVIGAIVQPRGPVYDNTGYYTHGTPGEFSGIGSYTADSGATSNGFFDITELSGSPIYLTPGVNNRLVFLCYVDSTKRSSIDDPPSMSVRVDIVPRWSGIRDA